MELTAEVGLEVATKNDISGMLDSHHAKLSRRAKRYPRVIPQQIAATAAGAALISFGSPARGLLWNLTVVTMVGADDHTSVSGTAAVYSDNGGGNLQQPPSLGTLLVPGATIPNMTDFSEGDVLIYPTDNLTVVAQALPANQLLTVIVRVIEFEDIVAGIQVGKY